LKHQDNIFDNFENDQIGNSRLSNARFFQDTRNDFIIRHTWLKDEDIPTDLSQIHTIVDQLELQTVFKPSKSLRENAEFIEYAHLNDSNEWKEIDQLIKKKWMLCDSKLISHETVNDFYKNSSHLSYSRISNQNMKFQSQLPTRLFQIISIELQHHPLLRGHQELVFVVAQFDFTVGFEGSIVSVHRHPMLYRTYSYSGCLELTQSQQARYAFDTSTSNHNEWTFRNQLVYLESGHVTQMLKDGYSTQNTTTSAIQKMTGDLHNQGTPQWHYLKDVLLDSVSVCMAYLDHEFKFMNHSKQKNRKLETSK
jgi:hypothetical protein